jgi:prepilin-type processing-associated H-X9-DG protein
MRWISSGQQKRDHNDQRNVCAADGHEFTEDDPGVLTKEGWRVHRSDTTDPSSGFYGQQQD